MICHSSRIQRTKGPPKHYVLDLLTKPLILLNFELASLIQVGFGCHTRINERYV